MADTSCIIHQQKHDGKSNRKTTRNFPRLRGIHPASSPSSPSSSWSAAGHATVVARASLSVSMRQKFSVIYKNNQGDCSALDRQRQHQQNSRYTMERKLEMEDTVDTAEEEEEEEVETSGSSSDDSAGGPHNFDGEAGDETGESHQVASESGFEHSLELEPSSSEDDVPREEKDTQDTCAGASDDRDGRGNENTAAQSITEGDQRNSGMHSIPGLVSETDLDSCREKAELDDCSSGRRRGENATQQTGCGTSEKQKQVQLVAPETELDSAKEEAQDTRRNVNITQQKVDGSSEEQWNVELVTVLTPAPEPELESSEDMWRMRIIELENDPQAIKTTSLSTTRERPQSAPSPSALKLPRKSILKKSSTTTTTTTISNADLDPSYRSASSGVTQPTSASTSSSTSSQRRREVMFKDVIVREYSMTLGDHPNCSFGPPVMLDWDYEEYESIDLDSYEYNREPRRTLRQMMMNYYHRRNLLIHCAGYTKEEIKRATRDVNKIKRQREITKTFLPISKVEEVVQSAGRKVKRCVKKNKKDSDIFVVQEVHKKSAAAC